MAPPKNGRYFKCEYCGKERYITPCEEGRKHMRHCSLKCRKANGYNPYQRGDKSPTWKGGRILISGYVYIKSYDHPNRNSSDYMAEHRLVMERVLNRLLTKDEEVHHRNGIKTDNRPENLEVVVKTMHYGVVMCPHCRNSFQVK